MTRDSIRYYALGRASNGALHAANSVFGPAICTAVLELVDDDRHFTDLQTIRLDICPRCRAWLLEAPTSHRDHSSV